MPTQPEPSQSAVDLLDLALGRVGMVRTCLDELRQPDATLVPTQTLIERAESCLDDVVGALRSLRVRVADLEPHRMKRAAPRHRSGPQGFCTPTTPSHP